VIYRNKTSYAGTDTKEERTMTVARVTELSSYSTESFEDAIEKGIERAHKTLRNVKSAWVKEQEVRVGEDGKIEAYQVNMLVTFVLED
jgi:flavin-binding protein dodecin